MKTDKLNAGELSAFKSVMDINHEIQAILLPLLTAVTAVENEAETDTHFMLRAVNRLVCAQGNEITRLEEVMK